MKRKVLSALLAFCMALSFLPLNVWAAEAASVMEAEGTVLEAETAEVDTEPTIAVLESVEYNINGTAIQNSGTGDHTVAAEYRPSMTASNSATDIIAQGYCGAEGDGTNLSWVLDANGTLTISGTGAMADWPTNTGQPWSNYKGEPVRGGPVEEWDASAVRTVVIENGVTSIGDFAFGECYNLEDIKIPASVTSIAEGAFMGDFHLKTIALDSGNSAYTVVENVLFNKDQTRLIYYPSGLGLGEYGAIEGAVSK